MTQAEFEKRYEYNPQKDKIGGGGFGVVYKAYDTLRNRYVAIKEQQVQNHQFTLQKEVELCNEIEKHDNIAAYENCYRFAAMRGVQMDFATMKFYEDGSLDSLLKNKTLSLPQKADIIKGVLLGIGHLHKEGIIHRDLKTANVLIDRDKDRYIPKIADFGLSRLTGIDDKSSVSNSAIGKTIAYAAPEQIKGQSIKKNVDLWAFGVIAYKILTGDLPFTANEGADFTTAQLDISRKILSLEFPEKLNAISEPFQSVIRRCWVLDADKRAQSADELLDMLDKKTTNNSPKKPSFAEEETLQEKTVLLPNFDDEKTEIEENTTSFQPKLEKTTDFPLKNKVIAKDEETQIEEEVVRTSVPTAANEPQKATNIRLRGAVAAVILLVGGAIAFIYNMQPSTEKATVNVSADSSAPKVELAGDEKPVQTSTDNATVNTANKTGAAQTAVSPSDNKATQASVNNPQDGQNIAANGQNARISTPTTSPANTEPAKQLRFSDATGDALTYTGDIASGKANGKGTAKYDNGDICDGHYVNNKREGQGFYKDGKTGSTYNGNYSNDLPNGKGVLTTGKAVVDFCPGGAKFEGTFRAGMKDGQFKVYNAQGKLIYEGNFVSDRPQDNFPNK